MIRRFLKFEDVLKAHAAVAELESLGWTVDGPRTKAGFEGARFFELEVSKSLEPGDSEREHLDVLDALRRS